MTLQWRARGGEAERSKLKPVAIYITSLDNIDIDMDMDIMAIYITSLDNMDVLAAMQVMSDGWPLKGVNSSQLDNGNL